MRPRQDQFAGESPSAHNPNPLPSWTSRFLFKQELLNIYDRARQRNGSSLLENLLEEMKIELRVDPKDLARIPATGPVIAVANHPFGILDGIILGATLLRVRPDMRIIANFLLARIEELRRYCIFVDPFNRGGSKQANTSGLRQALGHLRDGGILATFPAGEVSHWQFAYGEIADPAWNENCSRLARKANATIVPVFFLGRNSIPYHALGAVHPLFRTIQLPQQFINKVGHAVEVRIGNPISAEQICGLENDRKATEYIRWRTYLLRRRDKTKAPAKPGLPLIPLVRARADIAPAEDRNKIVAEIRQLESQKLEETREFSVFVADAGQIPTVLSEIGRLREVTFRAVGEGTGRKRDLDRFDRYYKHLILWGKQQEEIAGAYRFTHAQETIENHGISGLYTSSLFQYHPNLFHEMGPALELGRSFVLPKYQKQYAPLMMLWKGIARYIAAYPDNPVLFGAVSISNEYNRASREFIFQFFQKKRPHALAQWVRPKRPFRPRALRKWELDAIENVLDIEEISNFVSEVENNGRGMPILLRQYLKLGGEVLSFNLDRSFADALDGLIMVDLRQTDLARLGSYMGKESARQFSKYHGRLTEEIPVG